MSPAPLRDGLLLAVGTLTVLRVPAPRAVDRASAGVAMTVAQLAALPLGLLAAGVVLLGDLAGLPPLVIGLVVVAALALGTRSLHWDGLADTADGLTASYDRERSLAVMRTGDVGPAGTVSIVTVAGLQVAAIGALVPEQHGWLTVGLLVCASRSALALACARGVPPARPDGLGAVHAGSVPLPVAVGVTAAAGALSVLAAALVGSAWPGLFGAVAATAVVIGVVVRCVRRLGGVTGDVLGACIELSLAVLLVASSAA